MELDYIALRPVKQSLIGYIKEAQALIKASEYPDEKTVHDVRVLMKKARAALKLITPQLEAVVAERERIALREVGRLMSSWRETSVLRKTLKSLKKDHPLIFEKLQDNEKLKGMMRKPEPVNEITEETKIKLQEIIDILYRTAYRIRFEPINNSDPHLLIKELEQTYTSVTDNYLISRNNPVPRNLHELRKRLKDFLYQLWFFRPLNVSKIKALEKKVDAMTQYLGKYNDLSQFIKVIGYKYKYGENQPELDELVLLIRVKQDKYLSEVWPDAYKIFCPGQNLINILGFKLLVIGPD